MRQLAMSIVDHLRRGSPVFSTKSVDNSRRFVAIDRDRVASYLFHARSIRGGQADLDRKYFCPGKHRSRDRGFFSTNPRQAKFCAGQMAGRFDARKSRSMV